MLRSANKKLLWIVSFVVIISMILSACAAPTAAPAEAVKPAATKAAEVGEAAESTATSEPAKEPAQPAANAEPVELIYYFPGSPQKDMAMVQDAMNAILKEKINATISLQQYQWGDFDQKANLAFTSGDHFDLVFTAPWINNYILNAVNGNFVALDELLPKYAPKLYASIPPAMWEAVKVNGKIYAVPNQQIAYTSYGIGVRKDLAEKYNLDLKAIKSLADLEPFLEAVKQGEPDVRPVALGSDNLGDYFFPLQTFDMVAGTNIPVAVRYDDKEVKAFNLIESPEYEQWIKQRHDWFEKGYFGKELIPLDELATETKAGKVALGISNTVKPKGEREWKARAPEYDWIVKSLAEPFVTTSTSVATLTAVSITSQNPEAAIKYLELINTDPQLYNLLSKGIEGTHWVWADQSKNLVKFPDGLDGSTVGYNPNTDWMFGNQFNAFYTDPNAVGEWEETQKNNQNAKPSAALGFTFNPEPVKNEIAAVNDVVVQYGHQMGAGQLDIETALPEFKQKLADAGIDTIIAEVQKQLDAWKANK